MQNILYLSNSMAMISLPPPTPTDPAARLFDSVDGFELFCSQHDVVGGAMVSGFRVQPAMVILDVLPNHPLGANCCGIVIYR